MYRERIEAGAALLDRYAADTGNLETDWREAVKTFPGLDLSSWSGCVLGILFGDFDSGEAELDLGQSQSIDCGFYLPDEEMDNYPVLTDEWLAYLAETAPGTDDHA